VAVIRGENREVANILAQGNKKEVIESRDWEGTTPLMTAVLTGRLGIARMLLRNGASSEAKDRKGNKALQYARSSFFKEKLVIYKRLGLPPVSRKQEKKQLSIAKILRFPRALESWCVPSLLFPFSPQSRTGCILTPLVMQPPWRPSQILRRHLLQGRPELERPEPELAI
jgi:ankyrin repeat protein